MNASLTSELLFVTTFVHALTVLSIWVLKMTSVFAPVLEGMVVTISCVGKCLMHSMMYVLPLAVAMTGPARL